MIVAESAGSPPIAVTARKSQSDLDLKSRLALIGLIDEQLRAKAAIAPGSVDLFGNLNHLIDATVVGSKINRFNLDAEDSGFHVIEINADSGANLGRINMLYLNKPIACYYLVYVEVLPFFRKKGLGNRILSHFKDFLDEKGAVGILNNVIPRNDTTYAIYFKQTWKPVELVIGRNGVAGDEKYDEKNDENYMVYLPPPLRKKNLIAPLRKLLTHLKRKRTAIEMRDNENMVKGALVEFKELHLALSAYFQAEIVDRGASPFMRFMFTRFATKFIRFRRESGMPDVVVLPATTGEVAAVMQLAYDREIPVTVRGAGTNLSGGSIPVAGGIVLCMTRMDRMLDIDAANFTATVEVGVVLNRFNQALAQQNLFFPPDPQSFLAATIGGCVAENSGGPYAVKYGIFKHYLLGMQIVLPDGRILSLGGRTVKNVTGYDLPLLLCGSEGTLAVITQVTACCRARKPSKR